MVTEFREHTSASSLPVPLYSIQLGWPDHSDGGLPTRPKRWVLIGSTTMTLSQSSSADPHFSDTGSKAPGR
jgi:hypothetical protein